MSHHVADKQVISSLDGYATPLECRSGLMYMSILGKPTDQDLDQYPHMLLTSPHEWDPSVLDYAHLDAIPLGHQISQHEISMTPELMIVETSNSE